MSETATATVRPLGVQLTETDASLLTHDSYVMHIKTNTCTSCACAEQFTELYEVWVHPTKTRTLGMNVLRMHNPSSLMKNLPIAYIKLAPHSLPICSECVESFVHPGRQDVLPAADRTAWRETLIRKYTPEPKARTDGKAAPSLDML